MSTKLKAGFIGFIPKDADFYEVAADYAKIGYRGLEGGYALLREGDPAQNAARVRAMGLTPLAIGSSVQDGVPDVAQLAQNAGSIGAKWVVLYHSQATSWRFADRENEPDYEESMRELDRMAELSTALKARGLTLVFHTHDQEFRTVYKGAMLLDWMLTRCPDMKFELDLGWAQYAGMDVPRLIHRLGDRLASLHVKDYIPGDNAEVKPLRTVVVPRYAAPGTGVLDLYACLKAASEEGVEWAIIEQDTQYILTTRESVLVGYLNMKETGFVE